MSPLTDRGARPTPAGLVENLRRSEIKASAWRICRVCAAGAVGTRRDGQAQLNRSLNYRVPQPDCRCVEAVVSPAVPAPWTPARKVHYRVKAWSE